MLPRRLRAALVQRRRSSPPPPAAEQREDDVMMVLEGLQARVDALAHAVRDLDDRLDRQTAELARALAAHADLRDDYRAVVKARERLVKRYRGLASQPRRPPPTPADLSLNEAYDVYVDFVDFCKHVGIRPPDTMPDWTPS